MKLIVSAARAKGDARLHVETYDDRIRCGLPHRWSEIACLEITCPACVALYVHDALHHGGWPCQSRQAVLRDACLA